MLKPIDFKKATLQQLSLIIRDEACETSFKCVAESELQRRAEELGSPFIYEV